MFKTLKTTTAKLLDSVFLSWLTVALYLTIIGPKLFSAADTLQVILGIVGGAAISCWAYQTLKNKNKGSHV